MDREGLNHQRGRLVCFKVDHSNHVRLRLTPESHRLEFDSLLTHTRLSRTHTVSATSYLTNTNTTAHLTLVPLCVSSLRPYGPWWRSLLNIIDRSGRLEKKTAASWSTLLVDLLDWTKPEHFLVLVQDHRHKGGLFQTQQPTEMVGNFVLVSIVEKLR